MGPPLRVVIVDDHEMVRTGLRAMLGPHAARVTVVGDAADHDTALELVAEHAPDIVLSDVRMRGCSGLDLCRELRDRAPDVRVVLLSVYDDEQYLFEALRSGAAGYLLKRTDGPELVRHLELVRDGEIVVDPALGGRTAGAAARAAAGRDWPGVDHGLTRRESEVLSLIVRGLGNTAIADELVLGQETVKTHVRSLYRKLRVEDRAAAVGVALRGRMFR